MGSILLDGAVVEQDSFVAAGALLTPGALVKSRSVVMGRPARMVRAATDEDLESIRRAAVDYVQYARDFRVHVAPV
jgi:carbonic anhydrase/acetyltransferase-like protein (isoleucine patch superfamily)